MADGLDRLADVLRAPPKVTPTIGAEQTPRTFRMAIVTAVSPLTVRFNDDPLAIVEGLPFLAGPSVGGGGEGGGSGGAEVIDRGVNATSPFSTSTGVCIATQMDFTPTAGTVLVALVTNRSAAGDVAVDISDTFADTGGTAWEIRVSDDTGVTFDPTQTSIWTRQVGTSALSGSISVCSFDPDFNFYDTHRAIAAAFLEIPGATSPIPVQTANNGGITDGSTNALTVTFPVPPIASSVVAAMVMVETGWVQPIGPAMTRCETLDVNYAALPDPVSGTYQYASYGHFDDNHLTWNKDVTWQAYNVGGVGKTMTFLGSDFATAMQGCAIEIPMNSVLTPTASTFTVGDLVMVGVFEGGAMVVLGRLRLNP